MSVHSSDDRVEAFPCRSCPNANTYSPTLSDCRCEAVERWREKVEARLTAAEEVVEAAKALFGLDHSTVWDDLRAALARYEGGDQ